MTPYNRKPLREQDGIPVFSEVDDYVDNYLQISAEHLAHYDVYGTNPWMDETHWGELEEATRELFLRHVSAGANVLDVGVGQGRLLASAPGFDRYGMDISHGYLAHAKAAGIDVCFARIEDMPYKDGWFDAVVCTDVLEHVLDLNLCVAKILAVIRAGGHLIVRVPSREHLEQYDGYKYRFVHLRILDGAMLKLMFDRVFGCPVLEAVEVNGEVVVVVRKVA